ncbi:hypothetical protein [Streptosporangium canum]|uniref:hypothetical protein n=1 Tax=Streptosporangium canum TaxID=324952 RepID=UPI001C43123F|nr:hypothetical protein [Streptosporangium canum]
MVRQPLAPGQIEAGRRLGALLRHARAGRDLAEVAHAAGIPPETLRKPERRDDRRVTLLAQEGKSPLKGVLGDPRHGVAAGEVAVEEP